MSDPAKGPSRETQVHLERLRAEDSELDQKAQAWSDYFASRGVKRTPAAIIESWAKLGSAAPPWPPRGGG